MSQVRDVFVALNRSKVVYLLVGGLASVVHGVPRTTVDIDLFVRPTEANVGRSMRALRRVGLVSETEHLDDILASGGVTFMNDQDVDVITDLPGADFGSLWRRRRLVAYQGIRVPMISRGDQIRLLRSAGRPQDLADADHLENQD